MNTSLHSTTGAIQWIARHLSAIYFLVAMGSAFAAFPDKAITIVAPYPPGGSSDIVARILSPMLAERLKQPLVVENAAGAGGSIGALRVVRAQPDGYTLLLGSGSEVLVNKLVTSSVTYEGSRDLVPVVMIGTAPMVILGRSQLPAANMSEVLALARAKPGQLNYASAGEGTIMHLAGELTKMRAKVDIVHVPYRGSPPALTDLMGGQVDMAFSTLSAAQAAIQTGKVKVLAVTSSKPSELAKDVPPLGMVAGLEGFDISVWFGLFVPARTPQSIIKSIEQATLEILSDPALKKRLAEQGVIATGLSSDEFSRFLTIELEKYQTIVKAANITSRP